MPAHYEPNAFIAVASAHHVYVPACPDAVNIVFYDTTGGAGHELLFDSPIAAMQMMEQLCFALLALPDQASPHKNGGYEKSR